MRVSAVERHCITGGCDAADIAVFMPSALAVAERQTRTRKTLLFAARANTRMLLHLC